MDSADTDCLRWRGLTQHAKFMVELAEQGDIGSGETRQNGKQTRRQEENHFETSRVITQEAYTPECHRSKWPSSLPDKFDRQVSQSVQFADQAQPTRPHPLARGGGRSFQNLRHHSRTPEESARYVDQSPLQWLTLRDDTVHVIARACWTSQTWRISALQVVKTTDQTALLLKRSTSAP